MHASAKVTRSRLRWNSYCGGRLQGRSPSPNQKAAVCSLIRLLTEQHGSRYPGLIEKKKEIETHGFLTIAGDTERGFVGGCLLLNGRGRPLEFHCTAPVRPNRAQVILFGPTLRPYVVGEQIATALIAKAKSQPNILWTDDPDVLTARDATGFPHRLSN